MSDSEVYFTRATKIDADRSAALLGQCGYGDVQVSQIEQDAL